LRWTKNGHMKQSFTAANRTLCDFCAFCAFCAFRASDK
jgi:hypothetical protein